MSDRTARGNRIGLTIVGLALIAAAVVALARGLGLWPGLLGDAADPVTNQRVRAFAADHLWFWLALLAVAILIALLALRWLIAQTRTESIGAIRLEPDSRHGRTTLPAATLTAALRNDLEESPYLRRTRATLNGHPARPRLAMAVTLEPDADPAAAEQRVREALARLRQAMETDHLTTIIEIRSAR
ncbi:MAG TPA: alkaline shock response membrane anchor protein AmaP [Streptosporangiaceae bacterium]|jgi:hypothetical protein|nr:alkaline shock response membrane anchor protein AmaP [Streptosporangiaceae bacterium]